MATSVPDSVSSARHTDAVPPRASDSISRYRPPTTESGARSSELCIRDGVPRRGPAYPLPAEGEGCSGGGDGGERQDRDVEPYVAPEQDGQQQQGDVGGGDEHVDGPVPPQEPDETDGRGGHRQPEPPVGDVDGDPAGAGIQDREVDALRLLQTGVVVLEHAPEALTHEPQLLARMLDDERQRL